MTRLYHWLCRAGRWRHTLERRLPLVLSEAKLGTNVLEVGPGPGLTSDVLRSRVRHLTALEADAGLAGSLGLRMRGKNVEVVTGDAAVMPFPDATFSGCGTFTMLHHVPSPQLQDTVLREVRRVLRPGGELVRGDSLPRGFMWLSPR